MGLTTRRGSALPLEPPPAPRMSACGCLALLPAHPSSHLFLAEQLEFIVSHLWP